MPVAFKIGVLCLAGILSMPVAFNIGVLCLAGFLSIPVYPWKHSDVWRSCDRHQTHTTVCKSVLRTSTFSLFLVTWREQASSCCLVCALKTDSWIPLKSKTLWFLSSSFFFQNAGSQLSFYLIFFSRFTPETPIFIEEFTACELYISKLWIVATAVSSLLDLCEGRDCITKMCKNKERS